MLSFKFNASSIKKHFYVFLAGHKKIKLKDHLGGASCK